MEHVSKILPGLGDVRVGLGVLPFIWQPDSPCKGEASAAGAAAGFSFSGWAFLPVTLSVFPLLGPVPSVPGSGLADREGPLCWALAYLRCTRYCQAASEAQDGQPRAPHGVCLPVCGPPSWPAGIYGARASREPGLAAACRGSLPPPPNLCPFLQAGRTPGGVCEARRQLLFPAGLRLGQGHVQTHTHVQGWSFLPRAGCSQVPCCPQCTCAGDCLPGSRGRWHGRELQGLGAQCPAF